MQLEREVPQLVEYFNRACDWLRAHNLPVPKIDLMHLFGMDLMPSKGNFKLSGFHHDYLGQLEKSGIIRFEILQKYSNGFYEAKIWIAGIPVNERKTFFPQSWTQEQVVKCIAETYQSFMKEKKLSELGANGKYLLEHKIINSELKLRFHLDQKLKILSVYPLIKDLNVI